MLLDNSKVSKAPVQTADILVVYGHQARVKSVWYDQENARTQIDLSFGEHGDAKVYEHDEGKIWHRLANFN